ncbi:MAG TPA: TrbI/VirB10 family protein [Candidatus Sulfotelmatobacter sp.]|jgi:type IV secretion system protein VirB10|nr:TrbI/VirB10 family protein [Candidatus Sulfotelmatobacter sp.]
MSEPSDTPVPGPFRLRPEHPRVTRLSRRVLIALGGISALAIAAALGYGLQTRKGGEAPRELLGIDSRPAAEGLSGLPQDYSGIPKLGPALPGDLGKPILNAQNQGKPVMAPGQGQAEQRLVQETEAARVSRLFSQTGQPPANAVSAMPRTTATAPETTPPVDAGAAQNMQDRKTAFVNGAVDRRTVAPDRLADPASPYIVQAGTVIPAALITGLRSDLPGQITAQVSEPVYDSPSGHYLLIPQGARLIGQYDSSVAFGQSRVLLVWNRLIMPDGKSIVLERQPGADTEGYAGLEDDVDYHWGSLLKGALLSTILSVGAQAGSSGQDDAIVQALRQGASNSVSQTGQQIIQRQLNIQPTLTIRPGFPVRVIVTRDLVLEPYGE